jgi:RES domain-containing protein
VVRTSLRSASVRRGRRARSRRATRQADRPGVASYGARFREAFPRRTFGSSPGPSSTGERWDKVGFAVMAAGSSESEVLAQELDSLGQQIHAFETRLAEVERIIQGLEAAALTTARALEEVSTHWDSVYRAVRRAE